MFSFSDGNILRRAGGHPPLHFHFAINRNVEQGWRGDNGIVHLENSSNSAAITWFLHLGFFRAVKTTSQMHVALQICLSTFIYFHPFLLGMSAVTQLAGRNCTTSHSALGANERVCG